MSNNSKELIDFDLHHPPAIARPLSITAISTIPQQAHRITDNRFDFQRRNGSSKAAKDIAPIAHPASLADVKPNNLVDYALYVLKPVPR